MDFISIPSLKHQTFVKLAFTLWKQYDIQALMVGKRSISLKLDYLPPLPELVGSDFVVIQREGMEDVSLKKELTKISQRRDEWQLLEDRVQEKVVGLPLPEALKKETTNFTQLVGLQILNWGLYHECYIGILVKDCLNDLCWTFQGTIDGKKTAERLIEDGNLHVTVLYKLACTYCLEDYVCNLWTQISGEEFYGKDLEEIFYREPFLIVYWSFYAEGKVSQLDINDLHMFLYVSGRGNIAAASYFIQKLTSSSILPPTNLKKMVLYMRIACFDNTKILVKPYADIWSLLFRHMDKNQMLEEFKKDSFYILLQFINWPYQNCLMGIVQRFRDSLCNTDIYSLLLKISKKIGEGHNRYDYEYLFGVLWNMTSRSHKKYVIECFVKKKNMLLRLCKAESWKNIHLVLKKANAKQRKQIIFDSSGMEVCTYLMHADKWDLLRLLLMKCLSSKGNVLHFKKKFMVHVKQTHSTGSVTKGKKFIQFFRDLIFSY